MISAQSFTRDWLNEVNRNQHLNRNDEQFKNIEKAVCALHLLERLKLAGLDFIFKGGSELLLLFDDIKRLSVDIDIVIEEEQDLPALFDNVCQNNQLFTHWDRKERSSDAKSKTAHFRFFYKPFAYNEDGESYILLDVYHARGLYEFTMERPIKSRLVATSGELTNVTVLAPECLIADKLTAFAPTTIGIPLDAEPHKRPKRAEVVKQLFDIGILLDLVENVDAIRQTYISVANVEIAHEGLDIGYLDALADSMDYALIVGTEGQSKPEEYEKIFKGFKGFSSFLADAPYNQDRAALAAAKLFYLGRVILIESCSHIERYDKQIDMDSWEISGDYASILNTSKTVSPETFFYWYQASLLL
jgi:hypothetical protein